jgi:putative flippase GtrA
MIAKNIVAFIDLFYPFFKKIMPLQTFRYAACGGANMVNGFVTFTTIFHLLLPLHVVKLAGFAFEPYSIALIISSCWVFLVGFFLNKYIVFTNSNLASRVQLFRYFLSFFSNLIINYVLLKALVAYANLYPVLAQVIVMAIIVTISYFTQQYFTFKVKEEIIKNK